MKLAMRLPEKSSRAVNDSDPRDDTSVRRGSLGRCARIA